MPVPSRVFLASLRLCARLFFQPIEDTGYAVLDERSIEVDQQAKPFVGQPQVGQKLLSVNRRETFDRFDLDDHPILDNQVRAEPNVDPNRSIDDWDWLLADRSESALSEFIGEHGRIDRFQ